MTALKPEVGRGGDCILSEGCYNAVCQEMVVVMVV